MRARRLRESRVGQSDTASARAPHAACIPNVRRAAARSKVPRNVNDATGDEDLPNVTGSVEPCDEHKKRTTAPQPPRSAQRAVRRARSREHLPAAAGSLGPRSWRIGHLTAWRDERGVLPHRRSPHLRKEPKFHIGTKRGGGMVRAGPRRRARSREAGHLSEAEFAAEGDAVGKVREPVTPGPRIFQSIAHHQLSHAWEGRFTKSASGRRVRQRLVFIVRPRPRSLPERHLFDWNCVFRGLVFRPSRSLVRGPCSFR